MESDSLYYLLGFTALGIVLISLIPAIFFLLTLQKTLHAVSPGNRLMQPGHVWLLLIPVFNIIWIFITVARIADSIKNECSRLSIPTTESRPTYGIGLVMSILWICGFIPVIGMIASLAGVICWIIYWVKVNDYKNIIITNRDNFMLDIEREAARSSNP
ncbi:MAG: hypothetical protein IT249_10050 [Chitinophagaceae bacterium]|nr:hypothetical protein [Chitinophagaceae bacterium]